MDKLILKKSMGYKEQRAWSDTFIPQIKSIVGPYLLEESSFEIDTQQACDLIVMTARDLRIAARVRQNQYHVNYPFEFTIRNVVRNNGRTEIHKIIDGWGDWMFYGLTDGCNVTSTTILHWYLIDLDVFRSDMMRFKWVGEPDIKWGKKENGDGTGFAWFDVRSFSPNLLIATSEHVKEDYPF